MLSFALAGEFLLLKAGNEWYFSSAQENGTLLHKVHQKCAPRTSALLSRLFGTDFQSVPRCLTPALLQALQWLALAIHLTQSLYRLCKPPSPSVATSMGACIYSAPLRKESCRHSTYKQYGSPVMRHARKLLQSRFETLGCCGQSTLKLYGSPC